MNKLQAMSTRTRRLTYAGMLTAVGILLPLVSGHAFGVPGTVLLPMHIPVFLIGLLCGPLYGGLCGMLIPALNSVLTGMPPFYPTLPMMVCELGAYGLVGGLLYAKTRLNQVRWGVYPALVAAMIAGRLVNGVVISVLLQFNGQLKTLSVWNALVTGLPGIAIQLVVIPPIVLAARGMLRQKKQPDAMLEAAVQKIKSGEASCVVMKDRQIVTAVQGRGVAPLMKLYDQGLLKGAFVADKIIGKAAAMILVLGGAQATYGDTMSFAAKTYLEAHHIAASSGRCIDVISNREGNGICPMERSVMSIDDPGEGVAALRETLASLRKPA